MCTSSLKYAGTNGKESETYSPGDLFIGGTGFFANVPGGF